MSSGGGSGLLRTNMNYNIAPDIYDYDYYDFNVAPMDLSTRNVGLDLQFTDGQEVNKVDDVKENIDMLSSVDGVSRHAVVSDSRKCASFATTKRLYYKRGKRRKRGKRGGGRGGARVGTTAVVGHVRESPGGDGERKCDFCLLTSKTNPCGEYEELLVCNDCGNQAHPSCMGYDTELARRCRLTRWQCISCKTCTICRDPGDDDNMLFCDYCDKGYHMNCHRPVVHDKPNGKWACYSCQLELTPAKDLMNANNHNSTMEDVLSTFSAGYNNCNGSMDHSMEIDRFLKDYPNTIPDASNWTIEDVEHFVSKVGFPDQAPFFKEQEIDGRSLLLMKRNDVLTGLSIRLGPALKIYNHIRRLQVFFGISHSCSS